MNGFLVQSRRVSTGRFPEEVNVDVAVRKNCFETRLLSLKVFYGRLPVYLPWVEFFGIYDRVKLGEEIIGYFGSAIEDRLLDQFSRSLLAGEDIFIEYGSDEETAYGLKRDFPPPITRLGYKLFRLGFTWFKDWYFPEGFREGGQKLQGEKPSGHEARDRHLREICLSVAAFLEREGGQTRQDAFLANACDRARRVLAG